MTRARWVVVLMMTLALGFASGRGGRGQRATSGDRMEGCVDYGYVIGRDAAVLGRSDAHLFAFLDRIFGS